MTGDMTFVTMLCPALSYYCPAFVGWKCLIVEIIVTKHFNAVTLLHYPAGSSQKMGIAFQINPC